MQSRVCSVRFAELGWIDQVCLAGLGLLILVCWVLFPRSGFVGSGSLCLITFAIVLVGWLGQLYVVGYWVRFAGSGFLGKVCWVRFTWSGLLG